MDNNVIEAYKKFGVDVNKALERLQKVSISIHCWQLDDICGFEKNDGLTGGIQVTGNYPGKARNFKELTDDLDFVLKLIPGKHRINLHAIYQLHNTNRCDISPEDFYLWVDWAKKREVGLDFNPTFFSHPLSSGLTLSSADEKIRKYWIKHAINSRKISEYFGRELNMKSLCNLWIPDGLKDIPGDRYSPRKRLKESLDEIYSFKCDKNYMEDSLESKVFGIGLESYTVGSHEFYLSYALKNGLIPLIDTGHFHPTENVSDKLSALSLFFDNIALHVSRPVRWDSDHVLIFNDELKDLGKELVRCNLLERTYIGLDYFDASINRILALVEGTRNLQKALLYGLLEPYSFFQNLQNSKNFTELLYYQEKYKELPFQDVYEEFLRRNNLDNISVIKCVKEYEQQVLISRKG